MLHNTFFKDQLLSYGYGSISETVKSPIATKVKYDMVFINLETNKETLPDVFNARYTACDTHTLDSRNICSSCLGYVGHIGDELYSEDYYKNIYEISTKFRAKHILLKTDRFYPADFHPNKTMAGITLLTERYRFCKTYIVLTRDGKDIDCYYIHITKKSKDLKKDTVLHYKEKRHPLDFMSCRKSKVLTINPDMFELVINPSSLNIISDKAMYDALEES